jgi:ATP-dependent protease HslVU (ClpYQ) peptidase subunit
MLGLQAVQRDKQLAGLARVVADALTLLDNCELPLLGSATVLDGLLGLFKQASVC